MRRWMVRWAILASVVVGAAGAIWYLTRPDPVKVRVKPVDRGNVERAVANTRAGTVKSCRRAKLSPSVGGQIAKLPIREGDRVKAGQVLLELWNEDLVAETELVDKQAEAAQARARAACLQAEVTERESNRLLKLRKTGAASEEKTDRAVTEAKAFMAECDAAKASALMNRARVSVARAQLARTRLKAPFDGVVAQINGELHEYLTPSPPGIPTPAAVDLIDDSCFYVNAPIDEVDAPEIVSGMPAWVSLDALGDRRFEGKVRRIASYVFDREKQARTVDVEVGFVGADNIGGLLAGYSADVEIILDVRLRTLRVPTEAVLGGNRVFVYAPEQRMLQERTFKSGISNWDYTEVEDGLELNELVVVNVDEPGVRDGARAVVATEGP
jgi:HlyD family secretion protein